MKKVKYISFLIILINSTIAFSQTPNSEITKAYDYLNTRGEVVLDIDLNSITCSKEFLFKNLSVDNLKDNHITAYANQKQFEIVLNSIPGFKVKTPPSLLYPIKTGIGKLKSFSWDAYPTYQEYLNMMDSFAVNNSDICSLSEFGTTIDGRKLLCIKISDNVDTDEDEPKFLYSSSMHGDETGGYVLTLRLIEYLLSRYGTDSQVDNLIDNAEIWINPLANPDGTYWDSDTSVNGAKRYNSNFIDLNRNYPDPKGGDHPDNNEWQQENLEMINFMMDHNFSLSANFHGGYEVMNYPWDTWGQRHADDTWFLFISRQYADTVHDHSVAGYFTNEDNGVTNGYDWYSIEGGRQDFVTYFLQGREITIELDVDKTTPSSELPALWEANYRSMLTYMEHVLYGLNGHVTDSVSGDPVKAVIKVLNHDIDSSYVYADSVSGFYVRLLKEGTYDMFFEADNYFSKTIENVSVIDFQKTILDVQLKPKPEPEPPILPITDTVRIRNPFNGDIEIYFDLTQEYSYDIVLTDILGRIILKEGDVKVMPGKSDITLKTSHLPSGRYIINVLTDNCSNGKCIRQKLIKVD